MCEVCAAHSVWPGRQREDGRPAAFRVPAAASEGPSWSSRGMNGGCALRGWRSLTHPRPEQLALLLAHVRQVAKRHVPGEHCLLIDLSRARRDLVWPVEGDAE